MLPHILPLLPHGRRLIEPFVGSASVFRNAHAPEAWLGDINSDLISLYQILQQNGAGFVDEARPLFRHQTNESSCYYRFRDEFNTHVRNTVRSAALFLYLNRHGYNGLCRYNSKGAYNVPFGRYKKPYFPEKEMLLFQQHARRASFFQGHFNLLLREAGQGDVVYCDPPYIPLSLTSYFTAYAGSPFNESEQELLASEARAAARRGAVVIISNHDTPAARQLYKGAHLKYLEVRRIISRDGTNRKPARELLAIFG